ncbi:DUF1360 domain-containing protein [Halalkalibacter krulwichiae]|uniref:Sporulation protein YjcA n=1 Tax=Halalkalibacter krulwichiae TaxID=199441 RepID=A0A1X9MB27_9BACI|nr:DUF1360 domain-containing protein [Halalkalibacter krulwichiae]ARK30649.1 Sporulation protein YjcA [Halalkalibacter krulwichiae]
MITLMQIMLLSLATFRLTRLLVYDKITEFLRTPFIEDYEEEQEGEMVVFIKPRGTGIRAWIGQLISCYWCTGLWVAIFLYGSWCFFPNFVQPVLVVLSIAAIAAIIETVVQQLVE